MPWCTNCDRFLTPPTVTAVGACPTCGHPVEVGTLGTRMRPIVGPGTGASEGFDGGVDDLAPIPWHFKLLGVAVVAYLVFRFAQAFGWLAGLV